MIRTSLLRSAILTLSFGAPLLACGGQVVSIGSNQDKLTSVDTQTINGSVASCPDGYAHPNVCCSGGPHEASSCGAYVEKPFRPCEATATTYPNPLTCCPLSGNGGCIDTPSGQSTPPNPPSTSCTYACPPGWWQSAGDVPVSSGSNGSTGSQGVDQGGTNGSGPGVGQNDVPPTPSGAPAYTSVTCCTLDASGATVCGGYGFTSPSGPPNNSGCGGAPTPVDAGTSGNDDSPTNPPDAPDASGEPVDAGTPIDCVDAGDVDADADGGIATPPPIPGECTTACPTGWTSQVGAPDVCCRDLGGGERECFSQAVGGGGAPSTTPASPPPAADAGAPSSASCYASGAASNGQPESCGCRQDIGGHAVALDCTGGNTCTCTIDGVAGDTTVGTADNVCNNSTELNQLLQSCLAK